MALPLLSISKTAFGQSNFNDDITKVATEADGLLLDRKYGELNALIEKYHANGRRGINGGAFLSNIYSRLARGPVGVTISRTVLEDREQYLIAWCDEDLSVSSLISLAECYLVQAKDARGGGTADTINFDRSYRMNEKLALAEKTLRRAERLAKEKKIKDPCLSYCYMELGIYNGYDRETMDKYLAQCREYDPWFFPCIETMVMYLLPRWHGSTKELSEFCETLYKEPNPVSGTSAYAVAVSVAYGFAEFDMFGQPGFDWTATKKAIDEWVEHVPDATYRLSAGARLAHLAGDREFARSLIERLEGRWSPSVWSTVTDYRRTERWAFDDGLFGESLQVIELGPFQVSRLGLVNNGKNVAVANGGRAASILSVETGDRKIYDTPFGENYHLISRNGYGSKADFLIITNTQTEVARIDLKTRRREAIGPASGQPTKLESTPDGKGVAVGTFTGSVKFWSVNKSSLPYEWDKVFKERVLAVAISPDSKRIIAAAGGELKSFDTSTRKVLKTWRSTAPAVFTITWSPDGKSFATAGAGAVVTIWDAETCNEIGRIETKLPNIADLAWSTDGKRIIGGSYTSDERTLPGTVVVIDAVDSKVIREYEGHRMNITRVMITPDNTKIISGSEDGSVRIWKMP